MKTVGDLLFEISERPGGHEEIPVLTLTEKRGFVLQGERFSKRLATEDTSRYKLIQPGTFAFNPYLLWAGALAMNDLGFSGVASPLYPTFRVREGLDESYVYRILSAPGMVARYDSVAFGSVPRRRRTSVKDFLSLHVPELPSLDEQRRIAAILDRADARRSPRRAQLRGLNLFIHAVFQDFSRQAPGELVPASEAWLSLRNGQSPDRGGLHEEDVLTLSSVTQSRFDPRLIKRGAFREVPSGAKRVHLDDFLLARGNGNKNLVGVGVFSGKSGEGIVFPDTVIAAKLDTSRVDPRFFEAAWGQPFVRRQILSAARTTNGTFKVNQKALGQVMIPIPPVSVQREFAAVVAKIDAQRERIERALALEDELFSSLQYRAFRGEL